MKLTIQLAENGYILSYYNEELKDWCFIAVEDTDPKKDTINDARLTQKLLWEIQEHFQLFGTKHDTERCYVVIKNQKGEEME